MKAPASMLARAAAAYARRFGWYVFPIQPRSKVPHGRFVRHGHKDATRDPEQIERWWSADPEAGVALSCGMSGLVVVDVDAYKPECEFPELEQRLGALPETPRQLTPQGGTHYLFIDSVGSYVHPCRGAETKHDGYILLAPSIHPNGGIYRWDVGAHVLDVPIASLPAAWLGHLTKPTRPQWAGGGGSTTRLPSSGVDALDSWLGRAFEAAQWLGAAHADGRRNVRCPWLHEHSDGRGDGGDSSTVIFPKAVGRTLGVFRCSHSHCEGRTAVDVMTVLPRTAKWAADQAMNRERNQVAIRQLASKRGSP